MGTAWLARVVAVIRPRSFCDSAMRLLAGLLLLSLLSSCALLNPKEDEVSARSIASILFVTNGTDARIYYFIVGRETATLIDWLPHLNLETSIGRRQTARIDPEHLFRSETEDEVIVYWWHAVVREGEAAPGEVHSFIVRL